MEKYPDVNIKIYGTSSLCKNKNIPKTYKSILFFVVAFSCLMISCYSGSVKGLRELKNKTAISKIGAHEQNYACADGLQPKFDTTSVQIIDASNLVPIVVNQKLEISTERGFHVIDITAIVDSLVNNSGIIHGNVTVFVKHTTCIVRISELESSFLDDFRIFLESLAPRDRYYRHNDSTIRTEEMPPPGSKEPWADAYTHFYQMLIGNTSETLLVIDGKLQRGEYQRLMVIELNDQMKDVKKRTIFLHIQGWGEQNHLIKKLYGYRQ